VTEHTLFCAALDIEDPAARAAYLAESCAGNTALLGQVQALLAAHERSGEFLDRPAPEQIGVGLAACEDATLSFPAAGEEVEHDLSFLQPSTRPDSLGRLGHYEILGVLGRGGSGVVLKAIHEALQREVAIKVLAPTLAITSPARKRFLREARAAAALDDENIVRVYDVQDQPFPFLVMEYIAGETLQQRLDRTGPLDVADVVRLGKQIAAGLAAAHEKGLIHRDIKPSNILLDGAGAQRVLITDFGLARAADDASLTKSGVIVGTPLYMAPEQAQGEVIDHRADLFSLGSVLYVMCSGRPPFRASTTLAVLRRVAEDTPRPIREIIPEVPDWLCAIVARLHAKKPQERFQSAREVVAEFERCLTEQKVHGVVNVCTIQELAAPAPSPGQPRRFRYTRRQRFGFAAAVLLLAALTLAAVAFWPRERNDGAKGDSSPPLAQAPFDASEARAHQEAWASYLGVPAEVENSIGMELRLIPPGRFLMGSPDSEVGRESHEGPQHDVVLTRPFYMAAHDVTVGQFKAFVRDTGYRTDAETDGGVTGRRFADGTWRNDPLATWLRPSFEQTDDHPVVCVSWHDAHAFCYWLSEKEGRKYTLPTEAQWEYACRAGSPARFCFGDDDIELGEHAWYLANSTMTTHPVGQKKSNAWGLHDMHGLVWQWVADWYESGYYHRSCRDNPPGPDSGPISVRRGGSWLDDVKACRAAHRRGLPGNSRSNRTTHVGFRVVQVGDLRSAPTSPPAPASGYADRQTGFVTRTYTDADGTDHPYVVFVPNDYKGEKEYPVILFLHGAGEIKGRGRQPVEVGIGPAIKEREKTFPFITVFPQALNQSWQAGSDNPLLALAILARVCRDYKTDKNRLYLTGLSLGGQGTWSLAAQYRDRWAAIAPVCGANFAVNTASRIKAVPCWCFHGEADEIINVEYSRKTIAVMQAAGGTPRYTEYPGAGHRACFEQAYASKELYEFFLAHKKK
jgi:formylglycine-generating enzyme required for sulfatase activity/poly(3-hydroxybutyrate) depolymerase